MNEQQLRELAGKALEEVDHLLGEDAQRSASAALTSALERPVGEVRAALVSALGSEPELRAWVGRRLAAEPAVIRGISAPAGADLTPLGIHVICPQGDYDRVLSGTEEDAGRCPNHRTPLVPASD